MFKHLFNRLFKRTPEVARNQVWYVEKSDAYGPFQKDEMFKNPKEHYVCVVMDVREGWVSYVVLNFHDFMTKDPTELIGSKLFNYESVNDFVYNSKRMF